MNGHEKRQAFSLVGGVGEYTAAVKPRRETFPQRLARVAYYFAALAVLLLAIPTSGGGRGRRDFGTGWFSLFTLMVLVYFITYRWRHRRR